MLDLRQIDFIYGAGETKRFHTWPVLRTQNIADHSWHVAMLLHALYGQDHPGITPVLLMAALCHDAAEWKVGDLPAPAKRNMHERGFENFKAEWDEMEESILSEVGLDWDKFLTDEERRRLKLCDSLDGAMYCVRERMMGNKMMREPFINFASYIQSLLGERPLGFSIDDTVPSFKRREWKLRDYIHSKWSEANGDATYPSE
jgi:5'-deoxynucleotidase YfbR-like HD superfamily hydrolase